MPAPPKNVVFYLSLYVVVILVVFRPFEAPGFPEKFKIFFQPDTSIPDSMPDVVKITRSWNLPEALKQISGIHFLGEHRFACIQDETGAIFIFNTQTSEIESEIPFGPPGDYEALTLVGQDAYIACANGRLLEVANYAAEKPVIKEYGTHLTVKQNVEGLCYDKKSNALLIAIKGSEEGNPNYKGIYSFDLATKKMAVKPAMKIDLQDTVFGKFNGRNPQTLIQPSEIEINPVTRDIYITDGVRSQLLIMDHTGTIKSLYSLDKSAIVQPEGITFTPSGELYVASAGNKQTPAKLMIVQIAD